MSEQEAVQTQELEVTEQSLAKSVSEIESLTQRALEMNGKAREELVEQIKAKCEDEGLSSDEADTLLEEIGLVHEGKKVRENIKSKREDFPPSKDEDEDDEDEDEDEKSESKSSKKVKESAKSKVKEMDHDDDYEDDDDDDEDEDEKSESKKGKVKESLPDPKYNAFDRAKEGTKKNKETKPGKEDKMAKLKEEIPKTKSGAMAKFYEKLGKMKKSDIMSNYDHIMSSLELHEEDDDHISSKLIDVEDDINALVEGESLTPEFKEKASTIFEAAVQAKVNQVLIEERVELEAHNEEAIQEEISTYKSELVDHVDGYLNYVADQWIEENKLSIEKGIRSEITEGFISGLKNLFEEHYITIPEDKVDVVDDLFGKIEELESNLSEQIQKGVDLRKEVKQYKRDNVVQSITTGLSDTQAEKVKELVEDVEADNVEAFEKKVSTIKHSYFPESTKTLTEEVEPHHASDTTQTNTGVERYLPTLSRSTR
jgi:hypothetical protein